LKATPRRMSIGFSSVERIGPVVRLGNSLKTHLRRLHKVLFLQEREVCSLLAIQRKHLVHLTFHCSDLGPICVVMAIRSKIFPLILFKNEKKKNQAYFFSIIKRFSLVADKASRFLIKKSLRCLFKDRAAIS